MHRPNTKPAWQQPRRGSPFELSASDRLGYDVGGELASFVDVDGWVSPSASLKPQAGIAGPIIVTDPGKVHISCITC